MLEDIINSKKYSRKHTRVSLRSFTGIPTVDMMNIDIIRSEGERFFRLRGTPVHTSNV